jgi:hypothetical protein
MNVLLCEEMNEKSKDAFFLGQSSITNSKNERSGVQYTESPFRPAHAHYL